MACFLRKSKKIEKFWKFSDFLMNFQNLELTEKRKKSSQRTASLKWHAFREKVKKKFKIFWKIFWFFNKFPEFRINEKYKKPANPKHGKFARFSRKLVHVFQGKKKDGFTKLEMKLDL